MDFFQLRESLVNIHKAWVWLNNKRDSQLSGKKIHLYSQVLGHFDWVWGFSCTLSALELILKKSSKKEVRKAPSKVQYCYTSIYSFVAANFPVLQTTTKWFEAYEQELDEPDEMRDIHNTGTSNKANVFSDTRSQLWHLILLTLERHKLELFDGEQCCMWIDDYNTLCISSQYSFLKNGLSAEDIATAKVTKIHWDIVEVVQKPLGQNAHKIASLKKACKESQPGDDTKISKKSILDICQHPLRDEPQYIHSLKGLEQAEKEQQELLNARDVGSGTNTTSPDVGANTNTTPEVDDDAADASANVGVKYDTNAEAGVDSDQEIVRKRLQYEQMVENYRQQPRIQDDDIQYVEQSGSKEEAKKLPTTFHMQRGQPQPGSSCSGSELASFQTRYVGCLNAEAVNYIDSLEASFRSKPYGFVKERNSCWSAIIKAVQEVFSSSNLSETYKRDWMMLLLNVLKEQLDQDPWAHAKILEATLGNTQSFSNQSKKRSKPEGPVINQEPPFKRNKPDPADLQVGSDLYDSASNFKLIHEKAQEKLEKQKKASTQQQLNFAQNMLLQQVPRDEIVTEEMVDNFITVNMQGIKSIKTIRQAVGKLFSNKQMLALLSEWQATPDPVDLQTWIKKMDGLSKNNLIPRFDIHALAELANGLFNCLQKFRKNKQYQGSRAKPDPNKPKVVPKSFMGHLKWEDIDEQMQKYLLESKSNLVNLIAQKYSKNENQSKEMVTGDVHEIQRAYTKYAKDVIHLIQTDREHIFVDVSPQIQLLVFIILQKTLVGVDRNSTMNIVERQHYDVSTMIKSKWRDIDKRLNSCKKYQFLSAFNFTESEIARGVDYTLRVILANVAIENVNKYLIKIAFKESCSIISELANIACSKYKVDSLEEKRQLDIHLTISDFFNKELNYSIEETAAILAQLKRPNFASFCNIYVQKRFGYVGLLVVGKILDPDQQVSDKSIEEFVYQYTTMERSCIFEHMISTDFVKGLNIDKINDILMLNSEKSATAIDQWVAANPIKTWPMFVDTSFVKLSEFVISYTAQEQKFLDDYCNTHCNGKKIDELPFHEIMAQLISCNPKIIYDAYQVILATLIITKKVSLFHLPPGQGKTIIIAMLYVWYSRQGKKPCVLVINGILSQQFTTLVKALVDDNAVNVITYDILKSNAAPAFDVLLIDEVDYLMRRKPMLRIKDAYLTIGQITKYCGDCEVIGITANTDGVIRRFGVANWNWDNDPHRRLIAKSFKSLHSNTEDDIRLQTINCIDKREIIKKAVEKIKFLMKDGPCFVFCSEDQITALTTQLSQFNPVVVDSRANNVQTAHAKIKIAAAKKDCLIITCDPDLQRGLSIPFVQTAPTVITTIVRYWTDMVQICGRSSRRREDIIAYYFGINIYDTIAFITGLKDDNMQQEFDTLKMNSILMDEYFDKLNLIKLTLSQKILVDTWIDKSNVMLSTLSFDEFAQMMLEFFKSKFDID